MEAFDEVDGMVAKGIQQTDGQKDWKSWHNNSTKKTTALYSSTRHTPSFPKLGTNVQDKTNTIVGIGERKEERPKTNLVEEDFQEKTNTAVGIGEKKEEAPKSNPVEKQTETKNSDEKDIQSKKRGGDSKSRPKAKKRSNKQMKNPMDQVEAALALHNQSVLPPQKPHVNVSKEVSAQWKSHIDPLTRKHYYINQVSKQVSIEKPVNFVESNPIEKSSWQRTKDPETGKTCYYNRETGEISFDLAVLKK